MTSSPSWQALVAEVPRERFIPDTIWVDSEAHGGLVPLSRQTDADAWRAAVEADAPIVTQVDLGDTRPDGVGRFPSSSASQPSIVAAMLDALDVRPGQSVLEIGTGTGWNAALLSHRVGAAGRVVTIEVDPQLAQDARRALADAGFELLVVTGDGTLGYPEGAPFDRVIATASVREVVPAAWLDQLHSGGRLVTPWGTDWFNGVMLTVDTTPDGTGIGRFSSRLAFMRLRDQRRALYGWEPEPAEIEQATNGTTDCRGNDLDRMLNPEKGAFAIGVRLASCALVVEWDKHGEGHHLLELDDHSSRSWAQVDADLTDPMPFRVLQLGPRKLWDEAVAAYDWWHKHGEPGADRFGLQIDAARQWLWLDEPANEVRALS